MAEMVCCADPCRQLGNLSVGVAEAGEDRLDDRSVVEMEVGSEQPRRRRFGGDHRGDDQRRDPYAEALKAGIVVDGGGRRDVVIEASVLVVGDHHQRPCPLRA
jgi:hypothetical protein